MTTDQRPLLSRLPPLATTNRDRRAPACTICGTRAPFFDSVDFNKVCSEADPYMFGPANIAIEYYRCPSCDFIFADELMHWSKEDFERLIYNDDYIKVDGEYIDARPARMALSMAELLAGCRGARILDYGSGSGRFADYMAGHGFVDVTSYDPFSSPARPEGHFDIILCFEVLEHSSDPIATLADIDGLLDSKGCLIFSQSLQPPDLDRLRGSWWYLAPRNGHISLFSPVTLERLADSIGRRFMMFGSRDHLYAMAAAEVSPPAREALADALVFQSVALTAPAEVAAGWHAVEHPPEGDFRWTAEAAVQWSIDARLPAPFRARLSLRYNAEIAPGFAAASALGWGSEPTAVRCDGQQIWADVTVADATSPVMLRTPAPIRPADRDPGGDGRSLGLYVALPPAPHGT